jgi:hypothetical protein
MSITSANAAVQLLATAAKTLNALRERVQSSSDPELKALVVGFYDQMAALKEVIGRVTDENEEWHRKAAKPEPLPRTVQAGETIHYYVGDEGPYCQPCYDGQRRLAMLSPPEDFLDGVRRHCALCHQYFYEKKAVYRQRQVGGGGGGPLSWMGD